jgi:uncharacterized protein
MPRAKRTELAGVMADGTLKIRVAAPPVDGAANSVLVEFLSKTLGLRREQVNITAGVSSRRKMVHLASITPEKVEAIILGCLERRGHE